MTLRATGMLAGAFDLSGLLEATRGTR